MQMIFGATCGDNVDILGVGERGHVAPEFLRLANQVLPLFGAEHAMQEIMRVGVRHEFESSQLLPQNAVTVRTARCLGLPPLRGSGISGNLSPSVSRWARLLRPAERGSG